MRRQWHIIPCPVNLTHLEPVNPPSYGEDHFPALLEVGFRRGTRTCRAIRRVSRVRFRSNMRPGHHRRRAIYDMVAWIRIHVTYHASGRASYGWSLDQWYCIHSVFIAARSRAARHGCKATCPRITSVRYRAMAAAKQFWAAGSGTSLVRSSTIDAAILFKLARLRSHQLLRLIPALGLVLVSYFIALSSSISPLYRFIFAGAVFLAFVGCGLAVDATSRNLLRTLWERLASATI